jgi:hypothetical protein
MTLEFERNPLLERTHTRRWVSIIAVVIPVAAFVLLATWFVRAYIAPPTVAIPSPMIFAEAPPPPPALPKRAQVEALPPPLPQPPVAQAEPVVPPVQERQEFASALPMFATLAAAPPGRGRIQPAFADPVQDISAAAPPAMMSESDTLEPSEPIAGPVPLPRAKPHGPVALVSNAVPLPRPRPVENTPEPDLPAVDRHAVP